MTTEINAYSMYKIVQYLNEYDCGTISAFRGYDGRAIEAYGAEEFARLLDPDRNPNFKTDSVKFQKFRVSYAVNKKNNNRLKEQLLSLGFGVIAIKGCYRELASDKEYPEESLFVFDINKKGNLKRTLLYFGNLYQQDSITFAKAGSDFALLSTTPFFDEPNRGLHKADGTIIEKWNSKHFGSYPIDSPYYSKLGNKPFYWSKVKFKSLLEQEIRGASCNYTQIQAKVSYMDNLLAPVIWENDSYAKRKHEVELLGETFTDKVNSMRDIPLFFED